VKTRGPGGDLPGLIKTDKLNGIGVSTTGRYPLMPQIPSFEEQGLKPLDFPIWPAFMQTSKVLAVPAPAVVDGVRPGGAAARRRDAFI